MARSHYWYYLQNEEGQPVPDIPVGIYVAGTTLPASVYNSEVGGSIISEPPQVTTDENGFFEFWIADSYEAGGYNKGTKFDIRWNGNGIIEDGSIEYVDFVSTREISMYQTVVTSGGWEPGSGMYYTTIYHYLNNPYPVAVLYGNDNKTKSIVVETMGADSIKIWASSPYDGNISVMG